MARSLIADDLITKPRIERKISIQPLSEYSGEREAWYKSDAAKELLTKRGSSAHREKAFCSANRWHYVRRIAHLRVPKMVYAFLHTLAERASGNWGLSRRIGLRGFSKSLIEAQK